MNHLDAYSHAAYGLWREQSAQGARRNQEEGIMVESYELSEKDQTERLAKLGQIALRATGLRILV